MVSPLNLLNRLLPFATPGTPIIQDVVHLAAICTLLYFAPQIQEWVQRKRILQESAEIEGAERHEGFAQPNEENADLADEDREETAVPLQGPPDNARPGQEPAANDHQPIGDVDPAPGPARDPQVPIARNVGTKKAKSLARRDQRRAYHEFQRSQGEAQRARDAEGAAEREAALAEERARRKAAEAAVEAKKAKEREQKRKQERQEWEDEIKRRDLAVKIMRDEIAGQRICNLQLVAKQVGGGVTKDWTEKILSASGILGEKDNSTTLLTGTGWVVRVGEDDMKQAYSLALDDDTGSKDGHVSYDDLGAVLERVIRTGEAAAT